MHVPDTTRELIVCHDCDTVHRRVELRRGQTARCVTCHAVLDRHNRFSIDQLLALTAAATVLFLITTATPVLAIEVGGMRAETNVWTAALTLESGWISFAAAVLAFTTFLIPLCQIAALLWVLSFARLGRTAPAARSLVLLLHMSRAWSMTEVFLLGVLVAIAKLSGWVHVLPGTGLWSLAALTILLAMLSMVEPQFWWGLIEHRRS